MQTMSSSSPVMIQQFQLPNGNSLPMIGLGTYRSTDHDEFKKALHCAIECGYRHIDGAWVYQNEPVIGECLREAIKQSNGTLKRSDFYLTSKLWDTFHSEGRVEEGFNETLEHLGVDYLDCYLIHWPMGLKEGNDPFPKDSSGEFIFSNVNFLETWRGMEELFKEGRVRNIGVSNFNIEQMRELMANCTVKPVVNQIEVNPYVANRELVEFCQANDVAVVGYAPFGSGEKHEWTGKNMDLPIVVENPVLINIGQAHNKTPAQVCIRWAIQRNMCVLPKSVTPERIRENIQIFDFELSEAEMDEIYGLDQNLRSCISAEFFTHKFYPFEELKQTPRDTERG